MHYSSRLPCPHSLAAIANKMLCLLLSGVNPEHAVEDKAVVNRGHIPVTGSKENQALGHPPDQPKMLSTRARKDMLRFTSCLSDSDIKPAAPCTTYTHAMSFANE